MTRERVGDRLAARGRVAPWLEGVVLALAVLAILVLGGDAVRASYHGYLHATLGEAVLRDGLVPENPYHAGTPLRYYTLYPALGVWIGRCGVGPMWGFVALNVLAALLIAPSLDALGRACGLSFVARRAAFLAAVLGFNALGWTGFLFAGETSFGNAPVYALMPACWSGHAFGWDARLQAFLPKFLNVSSFAIALPFVLWAYAESVRAARQTTITSRALLAGASLAVAVALNPLAGGVGVACVAVAIAPSLFRRRREIVPWTIAAVVAAILATPFLLPALERAPHGTSLTPRPNLGGSPIANLVGPLLLLLPVGVVGFARVDRSVRWRLAVAFAICAVLVLVGEMPQANEYKMERMGALVWALPSGVALGAWWERGGRARAGATALLVASLPTTVLVPWAYLAYGANGPELPLVVRDHGRLESPQGPSAGPAYVVFDSVTSSDPRSVVVMRLDEPGSRLPSSLVQGNALAPALDRPLFVDLPQIHNDGQPDLERRLDLVAALYQGEVFRSRAGVARTRAQALDEIRRTLPDRPFVLFTRDEDVELAARLIEAGAQRGWSEGGSTAFLLRAGSAASPEPR